MPGLPKRSPPTLTFVNGDQHDALVIKRRWPPPPGFGEWPPSQRIEWAFQCSLNNIDEVLSWDPDKLDKVRLLIWKEVSVAVLNTGMRAGLSRAQARNQQALAEIRAGLARRDKVIDAAEADADEG